MPTLSMLQIIVKHHRDLELWQTAPPSLDNGMRHSTSAAEDFPKSRRSTTHHQRYAKSKRHQASCNGLIGLFTTQLSRK